MEDPNSTSNINFHPTNCPNELCRALKEIFYRAREDGNTLVFFDEIDAFMRKRTEREDETTRRLKCEMLQQLDSLESSAATVVVVAATNRPFDLDEAVVRVSHGLMSSAPNNLTEMQLRRFQQTIFVPPPDDAAKLKLFQTFLKSSDQVEISEFEFSKIVLSSSGYSGSDIKNICMNALMRPSTSCNLAGSAGTR